jgi:hypothetical protein
MRDQAAWTKSGQQTPLTLVEGLHDISPSLVDRRWRG